jgi:pyruvate/2-oxoglutarate dehydrogenase complex dihydrolipoamide acyltransferase (E2) component
MDFLPEAAGPHDPVLVTGPRPAGSIRRTSNIDTARPNGFRGEAAVDARARDLRTDPEGTSALVGEASLQAGVSPTHELRWLRTSPEVPALQQLIGAPVGSGFRSRLNEIVRAGWAEGADTSLLYLLLDDLPGATLVSGYAIHRAGGFDGPPSAEPAAAAAPPPAAAPASPPAPAPAPPPRPAPDFGSRGDLCAGWAHDATMMVHVRKTGSLPVPLGPPAPRLEPVDDPVSWHDMAALTPYAVRRRRRLDLIAPTKGGDKYRIDLHFRDSHVDQSAQETVLHEYTVTGTADRAASRIGAVTARAHVLPWLECPGAVASAERISGMELSSLRPVVRREFVGRTTCTHLNDSLRSLADIEALFGELVPATP